MIEINLLPRKEFEIVLSNENERQVIPGKFGTWSGTRFSIIKKLTLRQFNEYIRADSMTFYDVILNVLCAIEYGCRKKKIPFIYSDIDLCEWIDGMGGEGSAKFRALVEHAQTELDEEEKKSPTSFLNGMNSNGSVTAQD